MPRKKKNTEGRVVTLRHRSPALAAGRSGAGLHADPANPGHRWDRPLQAPGRMQVDFEERWISGGRTRSPGANARAREIEPSGAPRLRPVQHPLHLEHRDRGMGVKWMLYLWCSLVEAGEPWVWDFCSAARHHSFYAPWLPANHRLAGNVGMRRHSSQGGVVRGPRRREIYDIREGGRRRRCRWHRRRQPRFLFALQKLGLKVVDGQQVMLDAREIKSHDEITLLNMAAAMGDGGYQDIFEQLKPGVRESEIVGMATRRFYEMGSDCVEAVNAIAGERCSPHPHNFTDRLIRPGDQAYFDIIQPTWATRPATTGPSRWAAPRRPARRHRRRQWMTMRFLLKPGCRRTRWRAFRKHRDRFRDRNVGIRAQLLPWARPRAA
jgi:Xaa-Pro dipeptidase